MTSPRHARPRRSGRLSALALCGALLCAACGGQGSSGVDGESTLERVQRLGTVQVGYANEAPYAYFDRESDRLTGESVEIARKIFADLGVERMEGVLTEFGSLIPGLKARRFDVIAAGMYIRPERCREIAFTNPTYSIGEAFIVRAGNPLGLDSYEAVADHETARLGVVAGAVNQGYARAVGVPDSRILLFPDAASAVEAVRAERADAYGGTSLTVEDMLAKAGDPRLERAEPFTDPVIDGRSVRGYGAFGVRKSNHALLEALNAELETFIGSDEHLATVRPFGFTEHELPGDATAAELCRPAP